MNDDLDQLLESLKMRKLKEVLDRELERAEREHPSYSAFLARVLREEFQAQQMRFLDYRIRRAQLPERWSLDSFPWHRQPKINRPVIEQLAELDFIDRAANLVFIGPTGVGKTDSPRRSCSSRCRPVAAVSSSKPRISSTRCTAVSPITLHDACSTDSPESTSC